MASELHFLRSDSIGKLSEALAKAQGQMRGAPKDAANPFYRSKYADLASISEACRDALAKNGLAIMQFPRASEKGVEVETLLSHSSGEWVSETLEIPLAKRDAQGIGSAITYARRYALAAIVGVAPEDDDGHAAAQANHPDHRSRDAAPISSESGGTTLEDQQPSAADLARVQVSRQWVEEFSRDFRAAPTQENLDAEAERLKPRIADGSVIAEHVPTLKSVYAECREKIKAQLAEVPLEEGATA